MQDRGQHRVRANRQIRQQTAIKDPDLSERWREAKDGEQKRVPQLPSAYQRVSQQKMRPMALPPQQGLKLQ
jgi:hypothetical protein